MATKKSYRWGIIGCGKISTDFTNCLVAYDRAEIVACGARQLEKAQNFAKQFEIPIYNAYASYDAVAEDPNVDIIYVGTIHPSHFKSVIHALNNGKHVLCEKPIGMNALETEAMITAARKNKRYLMEAMWTRFFPAYRKMRELIKNGEIGDVVHYYADFGVKMPSASDVPRLWEKELGGGGMLDLGCYPANPLTMLFGPRMPTKITANGFLDKKFDVDTIIGGTMVYADTKQVAQISCNFYGDSFEEMLITGTKGRIRVCFPFHAPTKIELYKVNGRTVEFAQTFEYNTPSNGEKTIFPGSEGMIYQINATTKCLDEGRTENPEYTLAEMLTTMKIMDEMRRQIGLKYKQDDDSSLKSKL